MSINQETIIKDFRTLYVWQKAMQLNIEIYKEVKSFPKHEIYNMVSQITSSCTSITANIAEGDGLSHFPEKEKYHLSVAIGSAKETLNWIITAESVGYLAVEKSKELCSITEEVIKLLYGYHKYVSKSAKNN